MVVQHNLTAMNANRMLGLTTGAQAKSTEKLSSGYKINRAADDAAGLSISEKMRRQIRGLDQASTNADDGVSAVQTAEGALNEVQDMLQRMNELAVQAANGTNSENDRSYIQSEIDQLVTEIDRVAETTKFNETYLLKGDGVGGKYVDMGTTESDIANLDITDNKQADSGTGEYSTDRSISLVVKNNVDFGEDATGTLKIAGQSYAISDYSDIDDLAAAISSNKDVNSVDLVYANGKSVSTTATGVTLTNTNASTTVSGDITFKISASTASTDTKITLKVGDTNVSVTVATKLDDDGNVVFDQETTNQNIRSALTAATMSYTDVDGVFSVKLAATMTVNAAATMDALKFNLHVGADSSQTNKIGVNIESMSADALGVSGIKVTSEKTATDAIDVIAEAIQKVSKQRSDLGAVQNRLEHTINNLSFPLI